MGCALGRSLGGWHWNGRVANGNADRHSNSRGNKHGNHDANSPYPNGNAHPTPKLYACYPEGLGDLENRPTVK